MNSAARSPAYILQTRCMQLATMLLVDEPMKSAQYARRKGAPLRIMLDLLGVLSAGDSGSVDRAYKLASYARSLVSEGDLPHVLVGACALARVILSAASIHGWGCLNLGLVAEDYARRLSSEEASGLVVEALEKAEALGLQGKPVEALIYYSIAARAALRAYDGSGPGDRSWNRAVIVHLAADLLDDALGGSHYLALYHVDLSDYIEDHNGFLGAPASTRFIPPTLRGRIGYEAAAVGLLPDFLPSRLAPEAYPEDEEAEAAKYIATASIIGYLVSALHLRGQPTVVGEEAPAPPKPLGPLGACSSRLAGKRAHCLCFYPCSEAPFTPVSPRAEK